MRRTILTATLVAALIAAAAPAAAPAATRSCGTIAFTPRTEDGVGPIRARGVGCKTARRVAAGARGRGPSGVPGRRFRYRRDGFTCNGLERGTALPSVNYRCRRGRALVTFTKT